MWYNQKHHRLKFINIFQYKSLYLRPCLFLVTLLVLRGKTHETFPEYYEVWSSMISNSLSKFLKYGIFHCYLNAIVEVFTKLSVLEALIQMFYVTWHLSESETGDNFSTSITFLANTRSQKNPDEPIRTSRKDTQPGKTYISKVCFWSM